MSATTLLFLLAMTCGLGLALFRHPIYGLYTYLAIFYLDPPSRWWSQGLPEMRWSLLVAGITLLSTFRLKTPPGVRPWFKTTPGIVLILFTAWLWIQSLWALDPFSQREASVLFTKYLFLFFLVYRIIDTREKMTWFLLAHVAGCFYLGWLAWGADVEGRLENVGGPGINEANTLSMHLATAVVAGAMMILVLRGWRQYACIIAMPLILNAIVLAGSRSAFLAIIASGLVLLYMKPHASKKLFYGFAALGLVLFLMLAHEVFWSRMDTIAVANNEAQRDSSANTRVVLFQAQMRMAGEYPLGTGSKGTAVLSPLFLDKKYLSVGARASHNTFMTVWVEQGIPGVILFLTMLVWAIRSARTLRRKVSATGPPETAMHAAAVCAALTIVLVAGIFVDYLQAEVQVWMLALLASLTYVRLPAESAQPAQQAASVPPVPAPWRARSVAALVRKPSRRGRT